MSDSVPARLAEIAAALAALEARVAALERLAGTATEHQARRLAVDTDILRAIASIRALVEQRHPAD